jgi:hypothetical protein
MSEYAVTFPARFRTDVHLTVPMVTDKTWLKVHAPDARLAQVVVDMAIGSEWLEIHSFGSGFGLLATQRGLKKLLYEIHPTSCLCGGSYAWLKERPSGALEMIGCICHTDLKTGDRTSGEDQEPTVHLVPSDLFDHSTRPHSTGCLCHPVLMPITAKDGSRSWVVVHYEQR